MATTAQQNNTVINANACILSTEKHAIYDSKNINISHKNYENQPQKQIVP